MIEATYTLKSARRLTGPEGVLQLRTALLNISKRIPAANPGPAQYGDSGAVTDQMLYALLAIFKRLNLPSEVKTVLSAAPAVSLLSTSAKQAINATISRYAEQIAVAVNAYNKILDLSGGRPAHYPSGAITVQVGSKWAVATPSVGGIRGLSGVLAESVMTLEGSLAMVSPAMIHQGYFLDPGDATIVDARTYEERTGWRPWYKRWYSITGMVVGGAGLIGLMFMFGRRRRGRRRR